MSDQTNVDATDTGNTTGGETTEETTPQDGGQETTQEETSTEAEGNEKSSEEAGEEESTEPAEFVPYDFEKDVKLPEGYDLPEAAQTALNDMGKELGIPADKIQLAVDQFIKVNEVYAESQLEASVKQHEKDQVATKDSLLKDWGDDFEKNQASVNKFLTRFFKGSLEHMFGKVEKGKDRDMATRDLMPTHFEKELLELSKKLSEDTLEIGEQHTKLNRGLKDKFSDLNTQYKT